MSIVSVCVVVRGVHKAAFESLAAVAPLSRTLSCLSGAEVMRIHVTFNIAAASPPQHLATSPPTQCLQHRGSCSTTRPRSFVVTCATFLSPWQNLERAPAACRALPIPAEAQVALLLALFRLERRLQAAVDAASSSSLGQAAGLAAGHHALSAAEKRLVAG